MCCCTGEVVYCKILVLSPTVYIWLSLKSSGFDCCCTGEVLYSRNNGKISVLMHVDRTLPLWAFFDVYGNVQKIKIIGKSACRWSEWVIWKLRHKKVLVIEEMMHRKTVIVKPGWCSEQGLGPLLSHWHIVCFFKMAPMFYRHQCYSCLAWLVITVTSSFFSASLFFPPPLPIIVWYHTCIKSVEHMIASCCCFFYFCCVDHKLALIIR